jgi:hypothetical protein
MPSNGVTTFIFVASHQADCFGAAVWLAAKVWQRLIREGGITGAVNQSLKARDSGIRNTNHAIPLPF